MISVFRIVSACCGVKRPKKTEGLLYVFRLNVGLHTVLCCVLRGKRGFTLKILRQIITINDTKSYVVALFLLPHKHSRFPATSLIYSVMST